MLSKPQLIAIRRVLIEALRIIEDGLSLPVEKRVTKAKGGDRGEERHEEGRQENHLRALDVVQ